MFSIRMDSEDLPSESWQKKRKREYVSIYFRVKWPLPTLRMLFWGAIIALLLSLIPLDFVKAIFLI